jgi:hypothetical protein
MKPQRWSSFFADFVASASSFVHDISTVRGIAIVALVDPRDSSKFTGRPTPVTSVVPMAATTTAIDHGCTGHESAIGKATWA